MRIIYACGSKKLSYDILIYMISLNLHPLLFLFPKKKDMEWIEKIKFLLPNTEFIEGIKFKNEDGINKIKQYNSDYIFSILFPYIFPKNIINIVNIGIINIHPAFLPFSRGWNTPSWAIYNNTLFGVTIHWIDEGIDTGDIIIQEKIDINEDDTADSLYKKATDLELTLFKIFLDLLVSNSELPRKKQKKDGISTYYKEDLKQIQELDLDNIDSIRNIINRMRALTTNCIDEACYYVKNNKKYYIQIKIVNEDNIDKKNINYI